MLNPLSRLFRSKLTPINTLDFKARHGTARHGIAIGAIVKNEALYIDEWLKFHEHAGVDHFFIYDDGSTDDTICIAQKACKKAKVTVFPWSQRLKSEASHVAINNQILAYGHCLENFSHKFKWMSFIDIDEYLVPVEDSTISAALGKLDGVPLIVLPWVMFGTSGHTKRPNKPTIESYTQRLTPGIKEGVRGVFNVKCIFDPLAVTRLHVHRIRVNDTHYAWNDRGERFLFTSALKPSALSASRIQLNHYYSRSREDVEEKIAKGGGTYTSRAARDRKLLEQRISFIDANGTTDTKILDYISRANGATDSGLGLKG